MEFIIVLVGGLLFGYPLLAALLVTRGLRRRVDELESQLRLLNRERAEAGAQTNAAQAPVPRMPAEVAAPVAAAPPASSAPPAPVVAPTPRPPPAAPPIEVPKSVIKPALAPLPPAPATAPARPAAPPRPPSPPPPPRPPSPPPAWLVAAKNWLFTGNLVAKMGLLILFIGVSFLLKYASERVTVPIELRLAGIVLADIGLLVWGWRMRLSHRNLSLPIQGAALAILMLVTFGAFRLYHLIPSGLAFGLLFVLTAFTCLLAVLQNAVWLAVFGISGGFLSPIMTSTGSGSHVALFSYYALLNAGVLAIALKRTWRALNLLGFAFTFVIGAAWGVLRYSPESDYLSTQLFLILFFLFYVAIAVVYALRRKVDDKPYVDATIVFGTALAAFGLQLGLMRDVEFGNAFSALGIGVFYIVLAMVLWRRRAGQLKLLVESFVALGVIFGTLAIPFALDGRWTSAAWALEGAGVTWVALRQRQRLTFMFGMLVQAGAWISFIGAVSGLAPQAARDSNLWLGFLILAVSAFFMATTLRRHKDGDTQAFPHASSWFLAFAGVWFMAGAWTEILLRQQGTVQANMLAASGLATAAILAGIGLRMQWQRARTFSLIAQLIAGAALFIAVLDNWNWTTSSPNLFDKPLLGALIIFAAAIITSWNTWRMPAVAGSDGASRPMLAWAALWWFGPILDALSGTMVYTLTPKWEVWPAVYAACAALSGVLFALVGRRIKWDSLRWMSVSAWVALVVTTVLTLTQLYLADKLPGAVAWAAFAATWLASEWLLQLWPASGWKFNGIALRAIHVLRTAGPWIMLWKTGELWIGQWLASGGVEASSSWANFVPAWAMMVLVLWLIKRSDSQRWPVAPLAVWYRQILLPCAVAWSLLLMALWNLAQDGTMAPLPYLPLANPLDLSTGLALLLAAFCYRMLKTDSASWTPLRRKVMDKLPMAGAIAAYGWFNLICLRTAAYWLGLPYQADELFDSQFIQAMLSLVWSVTALILMWRAAAKGVRRQWMLGAGFLALVVAKLFMVDLDGVGSVARIVSFVGVGLLMVLIGYLAPYPNAAEAAGTNSGE
ncbi:Uncharacterized membrane protein [Massilia sp. CF038]|nr:Uncharacterized membrane protein [Massilia sp. CF038]